MLTTSITKSPKQVLNAIRIYKEISGAQLAQITGLRPSTIVYILRSLKKAGLIEVSRIGNSSSFGGKPPTLWRLLADKGFIIGIEIVPNQLRTTVIDFSCNIIHQQIKRNVNTDNVQLVNLVVNFVREIIQSLKLPGNKIIGVGVALPGWVDSKNGLVVYSVPLALKKFPLQMILQNSLNLPVLIANDANAGALGVKCFSDTLENLPANFVYLTISDRFQGIGAGIVIDHQLYEGSYCSAGEITTTLQQVPQLVEKAQKKYRNKSFNIEIKNPDELNCIADVIRYTKQNCRIANFVLKNITHAITMELLWIIGFLNPGLIVIGGDITEVEFIINDFILPNVQEKSLKLFPGGITIPKIIFSRFGIHSVSVGATALILGEIF